MKTTSPLKLQVIHGFIMFALRLPQIFHTSFYHGTFLLSLPLIISIQALSLTSWSYQKLPHL